jgi:hypothetical protein
LWRWEVGVAGIATALLRFETLRPSHDLRLYFLGPRFLPADFAFCCLNRDGAALHMPRYAIFRFTLLRRTGFFATVLDDDGFDATIRLGILFDPLPL